MVSGTKIRNNPNLEDQPFELMEPEHQGKYGIDLVGAGSSQVSRGEAISGLS